jgi:membrane protein
LLLVGVAGLVLEKAAVRVALVNQVASLMGSPAAQQVEQILSAQKESAGVVATVIGGITLLFGATGVLLQLKSALNTIWDVKTKPRGGLWNFIRNRLLSLSMILGLGFLLLVSLALSASVQALAKFATSTVELSGAGAFVIGVLLSTAVFSLLFAVCFKVLPDVQVRWREVLFGGFITAVLFSVGKELIGFYLGRSSATSVYGAAGALVLILLWVYYSAILFLFGAEFTQVHAKSRGLAIKPSKRAVRTV